MAIDMDAMLDKIKDRQWALADIDWDARGAETISDEFRPKLKAFMADLCDHVFVMANGAIIASGSVPAVSKDAHVVDAYLGDTAVLSSVGHA